MEMLCAELYRELAKVFPGNLFPKENYIFTTLADSEDRHAFILKLSMRFDETNKIHDKITQDILPHINETVNMAEDFSSEIKAEKISLEKAVEKALKIEETVAEIYLHGFMTTKTDLKSVAYIQQFYHETKSHAEMLKELMNEKGYCLD